MRLGSVPRVRYHHFDVFTARPYSGNSLAVFPEASGLEAAQMQQITRELRHFESIFLEPGPDDHSFRARVFDLVEELDFAGHPVIGAACLAHELYGREPTERWTMLLKARAVTLETVRRGSGWFFAELDQGAAQFLGPPTTDRAEIGAWFALDEDDLDPTLPPQIVSTGLRYLIVPVREDVLARARITPPDLDVKLAAMGAQFAYLLDAAAMEGRHWNNDGLTEDVATGSGAGCAAAYLRHHGRLGDGESMTLHQGRFVGRPSEITIRAHGSGVDIPSVVVGGDVVLVASGRLESLPA